MPARLLASPAAGSPPTENLSCCADFSERWLLDTSQCRGTAQADKERLQRELVEEILNALGHRQQQRGDVAQRGGADLAEPQVKCIVEAALPDRIEMQGFSIPAINRHEALAIASEHPGVALRYHSEEEIAQPIAGPMIGPILNWAANVAMGANDEQGSEGMETRNASADLGIDERYVLRAPVGVNDGLTAIVCGKRDYLFDGIHDHG